MYPTIYGKRRYFHSQRYFHSTELTAEDRRQTVCVNSKRHALTLGQGEDNNSVFLC